MRDVFIIVSGKPRASDTLLGSTSDGTTSAAAFVVKCSLRIVQQEQQTVLFVPCGVRLQCG
jgi:hypothetical protein